MEEIWNNVIGYEGIYEVSNLGRVKRIKRSRGTSCKILTLKTGTTRKYKRIFVDLSKNGVQTSYLVNRLVAQAFIPNPENKPQVNHIDFNTENNCAYNLEWTTAKENINHAINAGRYNNKYLSQMKKRSLSASSQPSKVVQTTSYTSTP